MPTDRRRIYGADVSRSTRQAGRAHQNSGRAYRKQTDATDRPLGTNAITGGEKVKARKAKGVLRPIQQLPT